MAEEPTEKPAVAPPQTASPTAPRPASIKPDIPSLSEEFDRAKWTLPPASMLAIALVAVAIIVAIVVWTNRYKPTSNGTIDDAAAVELGDHNSVLAIVNVTMHNFGEKPFYIHDIKVKVTTDKGEFSDEAASAVDYDRYFQAYPALKQHAIAALVPETKIPTGGEAKGSIVVGFPVNQQTFDQRKSLTVTIGAYDQRPLVITK